MWPKRKSKLLLLNRQKRRQFWSDHRQKSSLFALDPGLQRLERRASGLERGCLDVWNKLENLNRKTE